MTEAVQADRLQSFVERIERLGEERRATVADIKDIYTEAKSDGFDVKALRKVIAARRKTAAERKAEEDAIALYASALGMR